MSFIHICRDNHFQLPAWATHERLSGCPADEMVLTDCCCCRVRADETVCVIRTGPAPPTGDDWPASDTWEGHWSEADRLWWASYYDATHTITCGPGFGCNARPAKRLGAESAARTGAGDAGATPRPHQSTGA